MQSNTAVISAFRSSNKKRDEHHQQYLNERLRKLFRDDVDQFERIYGEKPNTAFMSKFILKCIVPNPASVVKTTEEDGSFALYYNGIRIILTKVNMIVDSLCYSQATIDANLKEINTTKYDLVKLLDAEYCKAQHGIS